MASGKDNSGKEDDKKKDKEKDIKLQVVVNGTQVEVKGELDQALLSILLPALKKAKVAGEPDVDRWVFTVADGTVLDKAKLIGEFGFTEQTILFLSLEAGVAG